MLAYCFAARSRRRRWKYGLEGVAGAMLGEPGFAGGVVGEGALEETPEAGAMMRFLEVDKLVGDDVLGNVLREQDRAPVEIERVGAATRSPVVAEVMHS